MSNILNFESVRLAKINSKYDVLLADLQTRQITPQDKIDLELKRQSELISFVNEQKENDPDWSLSDAIKHPQATLEDMLTDGVAFDEQKFSAFTLKIDAHLQLMKVLSDMLAEPPKNINAYGWIDKVIGLADVAVHHSEVIKEESDDWLERLQ